MLCACLLWSVGRCDGARLVFLWRRWCRCRWGGLLLAAAGAGVSSSGGCPAVLVGCCPAVLHRIGVGLLVVVAGGALAGCLSPSRGFRLGCRFFLFLIEKDFF